MFLKFSVVLFLLAQCNACIFRDKIKEYKDDPEIVNAADSAVTNAIFQNKMELNVSDFVPSWRSTANLKTNTSSSLNASLDKNKRESGDEPLVNRSSNASGVAKPVNMAVQYLTSNTTTNGVHHSNKRPVYVSNIRRESRWSLDTILRMFKTFFKSTKDVNDSTNSYSTKKS